jgi:hypothetical protein
VPASAARAAGTANSASEATRPAIEKPFNRMYFHQSIPNVSLNYMRNVEMTPESAKFQVIRIGHP